MPRYNIEAINKCMEKAQEFKPKFGAISDSFPQVHTDSSAYGQLPSSAALSSAVDELNSELHDQFDAAETKLEQVARALDAVVQSVQNQEGNSVQRMTARAQ
jgi:methyl-accepting chemotaxis protein